MLLLLEEFFILLIFNSAPLGIVDLFGSNAREVEEGKGVDGDTVGIVSKGNNISNEINQEGVE